MVIERLQYFYELCNKPYNTIDEAEQCEQRCSRLAESPSIVELNLSPRTFNVLYYANINTINDLTKMSEQELLKIKGLGKWSFNELKLRHEEYGARLAKIDQKQRKRDFNISKYLSTRRSNEKHDPN